MLVIILTLITSIYGDTLENIQKGLQDFDSFKVLYHGSDCGRSFTNRIVGGDVADLGQYPWMARIGYTSDTSGESSIVEGYECGGTIISDLYILTAAHCSPDFTKFYWISVRVGEHNTTSEIDCTGKLCAPPHQDIDITTHYCHKHYTKENLYHDICILKLSKPIQYNDFVRPICLPFHNDFMGKKYKGFQMEVGGWGFTDSVNEESSEVLLSLTIPVVSRKKCAKIYKEQRSFTIKKGQICVGGEKGKDSCKGDSGGPLMAPFTVRGPARYFIIGIVSFGDTKCGESNLPAVYTLVPKYMKWIMQAVDKLMKVK